MHFHAALMRVAQAVAGLNGHIENAIPFARFHLAVADPILQAPAVNIIHEHAGNAAQFTHVPALDDIRMQP